MKLLLTLLLAMSLAFFLVLLLPVVFALYLLDRLPLGPHYVNRCDGGEGTTPPPFDAVERRIDDYLADLMSDRSVDA